MDVWDSVARNHNTLEEFDRRHFDGKKAQTRFNILLRDHSDRNAALQPASGVDEEESDKTVFLDDLCAQVDDAKQEEARRAAMEIEAGEWAEESVVIVREEAMKSLGKRKTREGDEETSGGKMFKVLSLMNEANKGQLELRKYMFEKEIEECQKDCEAQTKELEGQAKERESQLQYIQMLQASITAIVTTLVNKL
ncbi:hypothetical protein H310_06639 [Aphanomyces invadans]|nr:hypothetical protein H310_06639 [Aphanomyces invadans]ETW01003.1 hypothetical protein H310_06639 [Aphanomyces invadans]|eukprot:XP_008870001.1 hypothetical protein H310_06639 [Aphanomyces invadans]